jgi:hypothetical protein
MPMPIDLRPLTLGELLDRSFRLYRRHFWLFVGLMAAPTLLVLAINMAVLLAPEVIATSAPDIGPDIGPEAVMIAGGILMAAFFAVAMGAYFLLYLATLGAITVAVSELSLDRPATIASTYSYVRQYIGRLALLMILVALRLIALFIAIMIPLAIISVGVGVASVGLGGVAGDLGPPIAAVVVVLGTLAAMFATFLISLRYSVAVPALVLESVTATEAIRRSVLLIRGYYWRAAIIVVFAMVITYAAMAIFQMPFLIGAYTAGPESRAAFWLNLVGGVSGAIGGAVTGPVMIIALALLYYDLRIRKEGLDLQIMMASLDQHVPPGATGALPSTS